MLIFDEGSLPAKGLGVFFRYFEKLKEKAYTQHLKRMPALALDIPHKDIYQFKHSGNAGDIIYALPTIRALSKNSQAIIHLKLDVYAPNGGHPHPLGNVMLNRKMFSMLRPLLEAQSGILNCEIDTDQQIDYDLDIVRKYPFPTYAGHIARWYFLTFATNADLGKPWLSVIPNTTYSDHLVIARSQRYRAPTIDYSFLQEYPKIIFVGVESEYKEMRQIIPNIGYRPVNDFLELAQIIAGSKLFIGNQSFPFSLAEALKVRRLLEVSHLCPNVIVEGANGYDFCYQPQFEKLTRQLMQ